MKILFLTPYPLNNAPSQRFRFEQYFELLSKQGYYYQVQSFLDAKNWRLFLISGTSLVRIVAILKGFLKRIIILFSVPSYDFIFIHREVAPVGPPVFEWLIAKVFQKKIIYDFDDAIWLTDRINESWIFRIIKWRSKVKFICQWSYRISCGNDYLGTYASQFNDKVIYNPTTIDTKSHHNPELYKKNSNQLTIGWTGSYSTLKYLLNLESVFEQVEQKFPFIQFIIIADKPPQLNLKSIAFLPWSLQSEITDLAKIDIGVMPLPDDEWSKGKCGFKALQYMSLQIPVVASPVGVNTLIIEHGSNGLLASSEEEWVLYLTQLILDEALRINLGKNGREKVIKSFSIDSNSENFVSLFKVQGKTNP
jgi:glycosyltransferase involved in cell wall biosynthesis